MPDFGLPYTNLFDEMMEMQKKYDVDERGRRIPKKEPSLWLKFYDAVRRYPKFQRLKDFIERANHERNQIEQQEKREQLEQYLKMKQIEEEKAKGKLDAIKKKMNMNKSNQTDIHTASASI